MPKVSVWKDPNVVPNLPEKFKEALNSFLTNSVAKELNVPADWIEIIYLSVEDAKNAAPLNIEIQFSVSKQVNPSLKEMKMLAYEITETVSEMDFLPEEVMKVTCWILPQKNAIYGFSNVEGGE